jgi:hypothetical protein
MAKDICPRWKSGKYHVIFELLFGGSMSLTSFEGKTESLEFSALRGSLGERVLRMMATLSSGKKTKVECYKSDDTGWVGGVTLVNQGNVCIPIVCHFCNDEDGAKGIFITDRHSGRFSTAGIINVSLGVYCIWVGKLVEQEAYRAQAARNILAVFARCSTFAQDAQDRFYPDPHKLCNRPKKPKRIGS